ncbi:hypothetical protein [Candidatus Borrarchaeum sp.]|uniref:hypothetical protein n=1 Tax=Candidatus Borrarchaeum sp. TaxID=2846742 RepID=UPI00257EFD8A|nr:hypothetical protein [Candidatus Borrarchaeum sp.]
MKKKSLLVLLVLLLSFYITLLKIDTVVALPNSQPYYYEENVTVRVDAKNDSLNEIRFQGTHLNITSNGEIIDISDKSAFENATYALLSSQRGDYDFNRYGNTFLHQTGDGLIFTIAYADLSQSDAELKAETAKGIFENAFDVTLYNGTNTIDNEYHIFTFVNDQSHFSNITDKFWDDAKDTNDVTTGFAGLLDDDLIIDIKAKDYAKVVMGFINNTRDINSTRTKLREVFFSVEYLEEGIMELSSGNHNFSLNDIFHHTGDISRYEPSNSSRINVYLPTPLEPNVTDPNPESYQSLLNVNNGTIEFEYNSTIPSLTNFNASFLFEKWPLLLVEKTISIEDSYSRGEEFKVKVSVTNIGEGKASDVVIDDNGNWDAYLDLVSGEDPSRQWLSILPDETVDFSYWLYVNGSAPSEVLFLNPSIVNYTFSSNFTATIVSLNATSNDVLIPIEDKDFPSLIVTRTILRAAYSSGEEINVTVTIENLSDLSPDGSISVVEGIPGLFDSSSISNNTSILESQYESGVYWVNFTLDAPSDHESVNFNYTFYSLNPGKLYFEQGNASYYYKDDPTTIQSNILSFMSYPQVIQDRFYHTINVEADFNSIVNPDTTMTVNVTITNFSNSSKKYRIINRAPYRVVQNQIEALKQISEEDNNFTKELYPGESYTYNYSYYIPDLEGYNYKYAPILVISNTSTSLDPVIAFSEVENIHINRRPNIDSVSLNATKLDRVQDTVLVEASCSDGETPRAELSVLMRINDSDDRLYNITMTFDETTNLFVGNFTPGAGADTGIHTFRIYVTDEHDLTGRSSYYNFTVKNTKPKVEWMELYETNVTVGDTIKGSLGVREVETPLFNLNISLYCSSPNVSIVYYGTLSLFESQLVENDFRVGTFDIEIDTSNWQEGTYDVYVNIEDDKTSITYYYGEITVQRDDSPFYANPDLIFGIAYNIGVILFLIFQFRGFALLLKREIPF